MSDNVTFFLEKARENLSRFCFMVWDYYFTPEVFELEVLDKTIRCTYGQHTLISGSVKKDILKGISSKGENVISFEKEWFSVINSHFKDFRLLDPTWDKNYYNTFLCMELSKSEFIGKENHLSRRMEEEDRKYVDINRKIHMSNGFGGVGIIEDEQLLSCAFAPHVVQNNEFSFAIIRDVWTRPNFRGRGFGKDVSSKMCEVAFSEGVKQIYLWVEENNVNAVRIYDKMGFKTTNKSYSVICKKISFEEEGKK